ncbi:MAG: biotin--[acetyl-CoA-carboxylase] ligase [Nocardioides sp.]
MSHTTGSDEAASADSGPRTPLDTGRLRRALPFEVRVYAELPSTNAEARRLAEKAVPLPVVVVAEYQSAGRGRLARRWQAPDGAGLTYSVLLRPRVTNRQWPWLPMLAGYAAWCSLAERGVPATLKWPNDVLIGDRKLAGILVERVDTAHGPAAVVGIGLNVSLTEAELPVATATSLLLATGQAWDRTELLIGLVRELLTAYAEWEREVDRHVFGPTLRTRYAAACGTLNRVVRVDLPGGRSVTGTATEIDDLGRLVVTDAAGAHAIGAGDVVHIRPAE